MVTEHERVGATGGSADSQAAWLDEQQWMPNQAASWAFRALIFLFPLGASWGAVAVLNRMIPRPNDVALLSAWLLMLIGAAYATALIADRIIRHLAPVPLLYRLTLVFPDKAPSKFKIALRTMTGKDLEKAAYSGTAEQRLTTPQQAAETLLVLVARLSQHDRATRGHSERVRAYSVLLGKEIGLSEIELAKLQWAALIHDVGKLDVPAEILNKRDRPNATEWAAIREHPAAASQYTAVVRLWLGDWVDAATEHHERWDGTGYPRGISGFDISLAGRLVAITDAFDTMTARRTYKPGISAELARAELTANAGTQFDPELVKAFMRVSIKERRGFVGPLAILAHFPEMLHGPAVVAASGASKIAAGVVAAIAATGLAFEPAEPPSDFQLAAFEFENLPYVDEEAADSGFDLGPIPVPTPAAAPDTVEVTSGDRVTIRVLANDAFPVTSVAPGTLAVSSPPATGTAEVSGGTVRYTSPPATTGTFSFDYQVCDDYDTCTESTVTVTVTD